MVDKRFRFACTFWNAEDVGQQFLDDLQVRGGGEMGREGENWSRATQAISWEVKFLHCVEILEMHLDGRAIGRFAHPYVEIFAFAGFKEENVIAVVEFGQFVKLV